MSEPFESLAQVSANHRRIVSESTFHDGIIEYEKEKATQILESCLDLMYCVTEGDLWHGARSISVNIKSEKMFRNGSNVQFVAFPDELQEKENEKTGMFLFTDGDGNGEVVASIAVKATFSDSEGHKITETIFKSSSLDFGVDTTITGVAGFGEKIIQDFVSPKK